MAAIIGLLVVLLILAAGFGLDWVLVRWVVIPAIAAIWHVTLPFWPVMGLFVVVSLLLGGGIRVITGSDRRG